MLKEERNNFNEPCERYQKPFMNDPLSASRQNKLIKIDRFIMQQWIKFYLSF